MTGLFSLGQLYLFQIVLFLDLSKALKISTNSDFIEPFQPLTLSCIFDTAPDNEVVSISVDEDIRANIKYYSSSSSCKIERYENGIRVSFGGCNTHECDCQLDGKAYIWTYNGTVVNGLIKFTCTGQFGMVTKSQSRVVLQAKLPSDIWTFPNKTAFVINETEGSEHINCTAACLPECKYNWTTPDGVETNSSVLFIPYVNRNQSGKYTCTAWNSFGNIATDIEISVQYRPSIKIKPYVNPYKVQENYKNLTIRCVFQDAFPIDDILYTIIGPGGWKLKSQHYTISFVQKIHSGTYTCTAKNAAGASNIASLTIDVLYGPVIEEIENVNITELRLFRQICNVTANPNTENVWWTRSKDSQFFRKGNELSIPNITKPFSDIFTCNAQNYLEPSTGMPTNVTNTRLFTINVQYGPEIVEIKDVNVTELSDFTATCNVTANPEPLRVWWTNKDAVIQEGSVLNLNKIAKSNSGYYMCHAQNLLQPTDPIPGDNLQKNTSSSFYINVQYGPLISNIENVDVIENTLFNISCYISSNPLAHRVWWTRSTTAEVFNGTDLIFQKIHRANSDFFTCHAENSLYPSDVNMEVKKTGNITFYINVQYGPGNSINIIPPIFNVNVTENKDIINITCQADCNPPCSYQWTSNSSYVIPSGHLLDTDVDRFDAGNYTCSANTILPTNISIISLEIKVLYAANIFEISPVTTVNESFGFFLECKVDSFPLSIITWTLNRTSGTLFIERGVRISKYSVKTSSCNQTGIYTCSANSGILPQDSTYTELRVLCSPRYNNDYHSTISPVGIGDNEPLNITVFFISYPKPKALKWIFHHKNSSELKEIKSACYNYGLFEHRACFVKSNVTEADFGIYKLQVIYTDLEIWQEDFIVEGNRRPDQPWLVNVSCGIEEVSLTWKSGFNGGEKQTFYVLIVTVKSSRLIISKDVDNGPGTLFTEEIILPSGDYMFAIFTNNTYGNVTSENSNCTISARTLSINSPPSVISTVAGSIGGIIVICAVTAVVFLFVRKRFSMNKSPDKDMQQRSCLHNIDDEEDGLKDNPMYVTSEPHGSEKKSDIYSVVNKRKGSSVESKQHTDTAVYSQVVRKNEKGKENAVKKEKQVKGKFIEMDSVYENSNDMKDRQTNDEYANTTGNELKQNGNISKKNKDGLIYADLDLAMSSSGSKFVIRGLENRNNYAIIDLTKTAEPLPSDSDSEDVNEEGKEPQNNYEKE